MRIFRLALAVPVTLAALALLSSPASATTISTRVSFGQVRLGPLGASVYVPIVFKCDPSLNVAFGDASVTQLLTGHKLVQGSGSFVNNYPGVPCTGTTEKVTVQVITSGSIAYRRGDRAIASADFTVFDPVAQILTTTTLSQKPITISR